MRPGQRRNVLLAQLVLIVGSTLWLLRLQDRAQAVADENVVFEEEIRALKLDGEECQDGLLRLEAAEDGRLVTRDRIASEAQEELARVSEAEKACQAQIRMVLEQTVVAEADVRRLSLELEGDGSDTAMLIEALASLLGVQEFSLNALRLNLPRLRQELGEELAKATGRAKAAFIGMSARELRDAVTRIRGAALNGAGRR